MKTREEENTLEAQIQPALGLSRVLVRVVAGNARGVGAELQPGVPIVIGTSTGNHLVLDDCAVSRYHVKLTLGRRGTIEVRDLASTNGTYVGVVRIQHVRVCPGTRITIGSSTLALDAVGGDDAAAVEPVDPTGALGSVVFEDPARVSGVFDAFRDGRAQRTTRTDLPYTVARARALAAFELTYVRRLHGDFGGNTLEAARRAQLDRLRLLGLFRKHGLH